MKSQITYPREKQQKEEEKDIKAWGLRLLCIGLKWRLGETIHGKKDTATFKKKWHRWYWKRTIRTLRIPGKKKKTPTK